MGNGAPACSTLIKVDCLRVGHNAGCRLTQSGQLHPCVTGGGRGLIHIRAINIGSRSAQANVVVAGNLWTCFGSEKDCPPPGLRSKLYS